MQIVHQIRAQALLKALLRDIHLARGGGGTSLQEANGDVPLDKVAFSQLD